MSRGRPNIPASTPATFVGMKSDYEAAKHSQYRRRRTGIVGTGSGADYHYRSEADYLRMLELARDMDRNDVIIGHLLRTAVLNTIQDGLMPDPQTGNTEANELLKAKFVAWATDPMQCSIDGTKTFADLQELALRTVFLDGDVLAIPTDTGALEMVEGHRLRTPSGTKRNVVHGILLNENRQRIEYWLTKDDIDPMMPLNRVSDIETYPAFDKQGWPAIFHLYDPKRVSQTRGVTALAPIVNTASQYEDISFAKLVQQQVVSCFALIRQRELGAEPGEAKRTGDQEITAYSDGQRKIIEQIHPAMQIDADPGETITGFAPNVPNPGAMEHMQQMLQLIGVNLGIPLVLLLMDASETNFSGWRGAVDQARMGFRRNQRWLTDHFLRPVYQWKVRQWTDPKTGDPKLVRLAAQLEAENRDIYTHAWSAPKWPYIQPLQDAQADELRVKARQTSQRRVLAERGLDIDEVNDEIVEDAFWLWDRILTAHAALHKKHAAHIEKYGIKIDPRELYGVIRADDQKPGLPSSPLTVPPPEEVANA